MLSCVCDMSSGFVKRSTFTVSDRANFVVTLVCVCVCVDYMRGFC